MDTKLSYLQRVDEMAGRVEDINIRQHRAESNIAELFDQFDKLATLMFFKSAAEPVKPPKREPLQMEISLVSEPDKKEVFSIRE
jgi:hypothetical protein